MAISAEWTADDLLVVSRALSLVDDLVAIEDDDRDLTLERKARLKINLSAQMRVKEFSIGLSPAGQSRLRSPRQSVICANSENIAPRSGLRPTRGGGVRR